MTVAQGGPLRATMIVVESVANGVTARFGRTSLTAAPAPLPAPVAVPCGVRAFAGVMARRRSA